MKTLCLFLMETWCRSEMGQFAHARRKTFSASNVQSNFWAKSMHPCAHASRFFKEVFIGDSALIDYAQQLLGYCLSGSSVAKAFFIFCGKGNNGKTTLMEMMKRHDGCYMVQPM